MSESPYEVVLTKVAEADYAKLDGSVRKPVRRQLDKLQHFPHAGVDLRNVPGVADLAGHRKLYVAKKSLRIIYAVDDERRVVTVKGIGPRADLAVYKTYG